jgi:aryl-alcohol dehydrogenase-like predicted oxidoreductase
MAPNVPANSAGWHAVVGLPAGLAELREQGLIANIGLSNVTIDQFHAARAIVGTAAVTEHYNPCWMLT